MRVPHTVPKYAFEVFRCSEETVLLPSEQNRTLRSENENWDEIGIPADLKTQALWIIASNWRYNPILDELPTTVDRDYLIEILPLDLPFELAIERIPYEHFWERAAEARWRFNDSSEHGNSWRRLYCERHLAEYLELLDPAYFEAELERCERLLELVHEHVHTLELRKLVPLREPINKLKLIAESGEEEDEIVPPLVSEPEVHHIPMDFILERLPYLREIYINIDMIFMSDNVDWRDFQFSVDDALRIGKGTKNLENLQKFSLTRSNMDRPKVAAMLQGFIVNNNIKEIDFSHCKLSNDGAHAIGAFVRHRPQRGRLKVLRLTDNKIGAEGLAGLVHGMLAEDTKTALRKLDLRLNPIGDDGAEHIAALLLRYASLEYLNLSGCNIGSEGGMRIAEVLASGLTNFSNLRLDCSNNDLGTIVGEAFEIVAKSCVAITEIDVRMCGFFKESEYSINESINRNRAKLKKEDAHRRRSSVQSFKRAKSLAPPPQFAGLQRPHAIAESMRDNISFEDVDENEGDEDEENSVQQSIVEWQIDRSSQMEKTPRKA